MKTFSKFDYPTAAVTSYKAYREVKSPKNNNNDSKQQYKEFIKQESQNQRDRVKQEQQKKKEQEQLEQHKRMREELQRKKYELEQLEKMKQEAIQNQKKAVQRARIKEEQDRIKEREFEQKMKKDNQNAHFRFKDALKRLEVEKEQNSLKERQAFYRRKINQEKEKQDREKANIYQKYLNEKQEEEKEQALQEQKRNQELFRAGLGRYGAGKNVDYSKTCFHNPNMVYRHSLEDNPVTAIQRGESEQRRQEELVEQRREKQAANRRKSIERGEEAMKKISIEKEYQLYCRQTQEEQVRYNMNRIEEGKRNQFTGLKPLTMNQIQQNKKLRNQQEFQNMFIPVSEVQLEIHNRSAHNYTIVENKFSQNNESSYQNWKKTQNSDSFAVFDPKSTAGKYKYEAESDEDIAPQEIKTEPKPILSYLTNKRPMAETRAQQEKPYRQDLNYSQSEQDTSHYQ